MTRLNTDHPGCSAEKRLQGHGGGRQIRKEAAIVQTRDDGHLDHTRAVDMVRSVWTLRYNEGRANSMCGGTGVGRVRRDGAELLA